jgi:hypothetical protein
MSDFSSELRQRVAEAQQALAEAHESGDDYQVQLSLGQIESFARLAAENHVALVGVEESLAPYGLVAPGAGRSLMINLTDRRLDISPG